MTVIFVLSMLCTLSQGDMYPNSPTSFRTLLISTLFLASNNAALFLKIFAGWLLCQCFKSISHNVALIRKTTRYKNNPLRGEHLKLNFVNYYYLQAFTFSMKTRLKLHNWAIKTWAKKARNEYGNCGWKRITMLVSPQTNGLSQSTVYDDILLAQKKFWVAPEKLSLKLANEYVILIRLLPPIRQQFQQPQFKLAETSNY